MGVSGIVSLVVGLRVSRLRFRGSQVPVTTRYLALFVE